MNRILAAAVLFLGAAAPAAAAMRCTDNPVSDTRDCGSDFDGAQGGSLLRTHMYGVGVRTLADGTRAVRLTLVVTGTARPLYSDSLVVRIDDEPAVTYSATSTSTVDCMPTVGCLWRNRYEGHIPPELVHRMAAAKRVVIAPDAVNYPSTAKPKSFAKWLREFGPLLAPRDPNEGIPQVKDAEGI